MSDTNTSELVLRPVTRNEITLTPTVEKVKRREAKGQPYLAFIPTKDTLETYINFIGKDAAVDILAQSARLSGQEALDSTLAENPPEGSDNGWFKREVADTENPDKKTVQFYYDISRLNLDRLYEILTSGVSRVSGVTKAELQDERDELNKELTALAMQIVSNPTVAPRMLEVGSKILELDAAIAAKSKSRRTKEEIAAASQKAA